ncbi:Fur family transcriptional regulator [Sphaerospermopsis sp. LEGE 08334]|jgi:Fur family peroxide stress response transcriptional regulator|uniref:Fur family transcriptional regulator n=1 Tax=Sphaerospermopsis sp. LEGE 08334 TaxID=1828651 RepID=UPI001881DEE9|nr:Fur family transcriptional regulator [Sphaerospermopsis sp. LEGE 08334]MBE9057081.1 transcriptional repressor [Sphaerospermopsis sp. LEGE 08334]
MQEEANAIIQTLKSKGLRVTPQRFAVYANLLSRTDHPTVEQLLTDLNKDFPVSSQATIYSSLQALREVGLVREVLLQEGVSRYDANVQPHHHFCCQSCGAIEDIAWDTFQCIELKNLRPGLQGKTYEVIVQGVCDRCHDEVTGDR